MAPVLSALSSALLSRDAATCLRRSQPPVFTHRDHVLASARLRRGAGVTISANVPGGDTRSDGAVAVNAAPVLVSAAFALFLVGRSPRAMLERGRYVARRRRLGGGVWAHGAGNGTDAVEEDGEDDAGGEMTGGKPGRDEGDAGAHNARDRGDGKVWTWQEDVGGWAEGHGTGSEKERRDRNLALVSDLRAGGKRDIVVVTTAAVPWMTGTAVNALLRVIYLAKDGHHATLVVPWLPEIEDQRSLFPNKTCYATQDEQTAVIRKWANEQVPGVSFEVMYYDGVYSEDFGSILPVGEITSVFDDSDLPRDVCVLEEPEHLTWHHAGEVWTQLFRLVVGVIHTNYLEYARESGIFGPQKSFFLSFLNTWVCRGYCHRVIKLSDALQDFPHSVTCNIHGVRDRFIRIGRERGAAPFVRGAYFLGKVLWAKGYRDLVDLMEDHYFRSGEKEALPIDFFGAGADAAAVQQCVQTSPALMRVDFHARVADPCSEHIQGYKVFVNASRSDVVCTATAEALAMGKIAVVLDHPSNEFFSAFPNCYTYRTPEEFSAVLEQALAAEAKPLSEEDAHRFTWEAATERFYDAVRVPPSKRYPSRVDHVLANVHSNFSKIYPQPGKDIRRAKSRQQLTVPG